MDYLPHLRVTENPIGHPPASACSTGHHIASPLPLPKDAPTNAMPSLPLPPSSTSSPSSPSSPDRRIPRAYRGVERRQRSRPSRGGPDYLSKLTHAERAAMKTASLRRAAFTQQTHQIASSLWTAPKGAPPALTATTRTRRHRPPTPSPIPTGHITALSLAHVPYGCERDDSPGFDADVEFEAAEVPRRDRRAHVGAKERLTIVIPGGKSEAYVAMAFERSCSLADDSDGVPSAVHRRASSSSSSLFAPSPPTGRFSLTSEGSEITSGEMGKGKTGLKIKIPIPNPFVMLSLRLAGSCRVSDEEAIAECPFPGTRTHFSESSGYPSPTGTSSTSSGSGSGLKNVLMASQDHRHRQHPDHIPLFVRVGAGDVASRSRTPLAALSPPYRSPSPESRVARRIARRAALAPYCAVDRLQVTRLSNGPCLVPY